MVAPTAVRRRAERHPEAANVSRAHRVPLPYSSAVVPGEGASAVGSWGQAADLVCIASMSLGRLAGTGLD